MKILKEIPRDKYYEKYINPDTSLGKFITKLNSLVNKEQDFLNFISSIKRWKLEAVSLWALEEALNYIDELLFNYSNSLSDETTNNKVKVILKFLRILLSHSNNLNIFSSYDNLEKIYLKSLDIEIKYSISKITNLCNFNLNMFYIFEAGFAFINMKKIFMDFINNNYKFNEKIKSELEGILLRQYNKWKNSSYIKSKKNNIDINPILIFNEIMDKNKDYRNKNDFTEIKNVYEYFVENNIYEKDQMIDVTKDNNNYLANDEKRFIIIVNDFFCVLNFMRMINDDKINHEKIYICFNFIFSLINLCSLINPCFENMKIPNRFIESFAKDFVSILISSNNVNLKIIFFEYAIIFLKKGHPYSNLLFQNNLIQSILFDTINPQKNALIILTEEESHNQILIKKIYNYWINYISSLPSSIIAKLLKPPENNIYLYNLDIINYLFKKKIHFSEDMISDAILPRLVYELNHINDAKNEIKSIHNIESPDINEKDYVLSNILLFFIKLVMNSTNINIVNKIENILIEPIKEYLKNEELKKKIELDGTYFNIIYLIVTICNTFPSKIPVYISNGLIPLIIDSFSNYIPKSDDNITLLFLMLNSISVHEKGKEYLIEKDCAINLINRVFEIISKDDSFFYYELYDTNEITSVKFSHFADFLKKQGDGIKNIITNFYINLNSFMEKFREEILNTKIEYSEKLTLNVAQFKAKNKLIFIYMFLNPFFKSIQRIIFNVDSDLIENMKNNYINLLSIPQVLLLDSIIFEKPLKLREENNLSEFLKQLLNNFDELIKKTKELNIHQNQKNKIILNYQKIVEDSLENLYLNSYPKSDFFNNYCTCFTKLFVERINENSNISLFFKKYNNYTVYINEKYLIHYLSKENKPELSKFYIQNLNKIELNRYLNFFQDQKVIILNEDNYLDIKSKQRFDIPYKEDIINNPDDFDKNIIITQDLDLLNSFRFMQVIGKSINTELKNISLKNFETIKNYLNLSYIVCLLLKYFRKTTFENITAKTEPAEIIACLLKIQNLLEIIEPLFRTNSLQSYYSLIVSFYVIKYGGIRQVLKISKKLLELCKNESKKVEIPIVESFIINKVWRLIYSIILNLINKQFLQSFECYILLILENEIAKKLANPEELYCYIYYIMLKDIKEVFFNGKNDEKNAEYLTDMDHYGYYMQRYLIFCLNRYMEYMNKKRGTNNNSLIYIYEKGFKVYEVMSLFAKGIVNKDQILEILEKRKEQKNEDNQNQDSEININDILLNIEDYTPYPQEEFINLIKSTIDENNKVFKKEKDKENNPSRIANIDYNFDNYSKLIKDIINIFNKTCLSNEEIVNIRKQFLNYKIQNHDGDILTILDNSFKEINAIQNNILLDKEIQFEKELSTKYGYNFNLMINNLYFNEIEEEKHATLYDLIIKNKIIQNNIESIRKIILDLNNNRYNSNKIRKFIYENLLSLYAYFKLINHIKKEFDDEKKLFLDMFMELLKHDSENLIPENYIIEENILNIILLNIIHNFTDIKILEPYLNQGLLNKILNLKFYKENANKSIFENKFKSFVILNECFKQFMLKIFSEENILQNLIESVLLYAWANLKKNNENDEIYLDDFIFLCSEYAEKYEKTFKNALIKLFDVVQVKNNDKIQRRHERKKSIKNALKLKLEYEHKIIEIQKDMTIDKNNNISDTNNLEKKEEKNEVSEENKNPKINDTENLKKNITLNEEKIKEECQIIPDINKSLFNNLLEHIWSSTIKIQEDINKNEDYLIFSRNYLIDLDTSLISLSCILYSFPSYLSLILNYKIGEKNKKSFIHFLITKIIPTLNYYHSCFLLNDSEKYEKIYQNLQHFTCKKKYLCIPNSNFGSFEAYRYIYIIRYLIHSMTYKKRNMNEDDIILIKKCRKKILYEIDNSLKKISERDIKDFNNIKNLNDHIPQSIVLYKSNILVLLSLIEYFNEEPYNVLYNQYNPFEISKSIFDGKCDIITSISIILKNMKVNQNNQLFHEIGVLYLTQLFKYLNLKNKANISINKIIGDKEIEEENEIIEDMEEEITENSCDKKDDDNANAIDNDKLKIYKDVTETQMTHILQEEDSEAKIENNLNIEKDFGNFDNISKGPNNNDILEDNLNLENFLSRYSMNQLNIEQGNSNYNFDEPESENHNYNEFEEGESEFNEEVEEEELDQSIHELVDDENFGFITNLRRVNNNNENMFNFRIRDDDRDNLFINRFFNLFGRGRPRLRRDIHNPIRQKFDDTNFFKDFTQTNYDFFIHNTFEKSLSFMFSFNKINEKNPLIKFYKSNMEIKLFENKKKIETLNNICNNYIYIYLQPVEHYFDINLYFPFIVSNILSLENFIEIIKVKRNNFMDLCTNLYDKYIVDQKLLLNIKQNILKEANVVKLKKNIFNIKKEKKNNNSNLSISHGFINYITSEENLSGDNSNTSIIDKKEEKDKDNNMIIEEKEKEKKDEENKYMEIEKKNEEENKKSKDGDEKEKDNKEEGKDKGKVENKDNEDENNDKNKDESNKDNKDENKDNNNNKDEENKDKQDNNYDLFLYELPKDLREDILMDMDPVNVLNLNPELQAEYDRLMRRPIKSIEKPPIQSSSFDFMEDSFIHYSDSEDNDDNEFKYKEIILTCYNFKKEDIFLCYKYDKEIVERIMENLDDKFIENLILYNMKSILAKDFKAYADSSNIHTKLIIDLFYKADIRYKILDILFILLQFDISYIDEFSKKEKIFDKNYFLKGLYYLFFEVSLNDDIYLEFCNYFFSYVSTDFPKEMKKYFLNSKFGEKGGYIYLKNNKLYNITKNAKNLKKLLNIKYYINKNVLCNLLKNNFSRNISNIHTIYNNLIFYKILIKNTDDLEEENKDNNALTLNSNTIEKMIDLYNEFRISKNINHLLVNNYPTLILNKLMKDKNNYQIILNQLLKKFTALKEDLIQEIETILNNKQINKDKFKSILKGDALLQLIILLENIGNNIFIKIKNLVEKKELDESNKKIQKKLFLQYKNYILKINEILHPCWELLGKLLTTMNIKGRKKDNKILYVIYTLQAYIHLAYIYIVFFSKKLPKHLTHFIIEKNYEAVYKSPKHNVLNSDNDSSIITFFYKFCKDNSKMINSIIKKFPQKFPYDLIIKLSPIMDIENKKQYFKQELKKLPRNFQSINIKVHRNGRQLFTDSFGALWCKKPEQWRSRFQIKFEGEIGIDAGGLKREWLSLLSKELFNPDNMLFINAASGTYTINPNSGKLYVDENLKHFEFIGKIIAKAIYDEMLIDVHFTRIIYKLITNTPISYHDMQDYDPTYYNSLKKILENDYTGEDMNLAYCYDYDNFGKIEIVDLIENGRNIDVTEENKFDYVQKLCNSKLYINIKPQIEAFLKGFYSIIPQKLISIFNYRELELVISGFPDIDVKDWKANTIYENYTEETPIIKYFWEIIESYDKNERAEFLQFVTGCSRVPLEGFKALQGMNGINKFTISKLFDKNFERLPTAHTCFNKLDLPEYPSKEILKKRLEYAIKEGKGFEMA